MNRKYAKISICINIPDCFFALILLINDTACSCMMQIVVAEKSNLTFILFILFILTHASMNFWCFHRKLTIQLRFWLVNLAWLPFSMTSYISWFSFLTNKGCL